MQRLLAAALLACYGILGAIATGPHGHPPPSPVQPAAAQGPSWQPGALTPEADPGAAPGSHCRLCAWSRTQTPAGALAACEPAPPRPCIVTFTGTAGIRPPAARGVLLRAPPSA